MTKLYPNLPLVRTNAPDSQNLPTGFRQEREFGNGGKQGSRKDENQKIVKDERVLLGQRLGADAHSSGRFLLFEQKLAEAKQEQSSGHKDNSEGMEETVQILFETQATGRIGLPKDLAPVVVRSGADKFDAGVERIINNVVMRAESAARPGPIMSSGPVIINIPIEQSSLGLTRIEVTLTDALVTVKLCYPGTTSVNGTNPQLLAAAGQLGQVMQLQLPGREVKIVKSIAPGNDTGDDTLGGLNDPQSVEKVPGEPHRGGR